MGGVTDRRSSVKKSSLKNPGHKDVIAAHLKAQHIACQKARADLIGLAERGMLEQRKRGKPIMFVSP